MVAEHGNAILDIMDSPDAVDMLQRWVSACPVTELHWRGGTAVRPMQWGRCAVAVHRFGASLSADTLSMQGFRLAYPSLPSHRVWALILDCAEVAGKPSWEATWRDLP